VTNLVTAVLKRYPNRFMWALLGMTLQIIFCDDFSVKNFPTNIWILLLQPRRRTTGLFTATLRPVRTAGIPSYCSISLARHKPSLNPSRCCSKGSLNTDRVSNLDIAKLPSRHVFYFPPVLGLPALLDVIVVEYALHGFLEKAAGPLGCLSTLHFLPYFSPIGVSLPRLLGIALSPVISPVRLPPLSLSYYGKSLTDGPFGYSLLCFLY